MIEQGRVLTGNGSVTDPLIGAPSRPYPSMKALDVLCPYCNAAPCEPCRSVRTPEVAATVTYSSQPGTSYRRIKRPHPERVYAAREMSAPARGQARESS